VAGIGYLSAGSPKKVKADKYGVKESAPVELLSKKKQEDGGKITFKCLITRYNDSYMMFAKVLKNDSAVHIVRPGVRFMLENGDDVVLKAERPSDCCSDWADGRWYNTSFRLNADDVRKLSESEIHSVTIPFYGGEISRPAATGKEKAIAELLQSIGED